MKPVNNLIKESSLILLLLFNFWFIHLCCTSKLMQHIKQLLCTFYHIHRSSPFSSPFQKEISVAIHHNSIIQSSKTLPVEVSSSVPFQKDIPFVCYVVVIDPLQTSFMSSWTPVMATRPLIYLTSSAIHALLAPPSWPEPNSHSGVTGMQT